MGLRWNQSVVKDVSRGVSRPKGRLTGHDSAVSSCRRLSTAACSQIEHIYHDVSLFYMALEKGTRRSYRSSVVDARCHVRKNDLLRNSHRDDESTFGFWFAFAMQAVAKIALVLKAREFLARVQLEASVECAKQSSKQIEKEEVRLLKASPRAVGSNDNFTMSNDLIAQRSGGCGGKGGGWRTSRRRRQLL